MAPDVISVNRDIWSHPRGSACPGPGAVGRAESEAQGKRNPVSNHLCRDAGAWTAIVSVIRVIVGFQVHGPPGPPRGTDSPLLYRDDHSGAR